MKIRNIFILTALLLAIIFISACDNWDGSGSQGGIIINFGDSGGRYTIDTNTMIYTITMTGGRNTIEKVTNKGDTSVSIYPVPEGRWNIKVNAIGDRIRGRQNDVNGVAVTVSAGKRASVSIEMTVTGTRVSSWAQLKDDFKELENENGKLKDLEDIEIIPIDDRSFEVNTTAISNAPTLKTDKTITMWSETNVIIKRSDGIATESTVFTIDKGTLILETRNGGTITIDGNRNSVRSCSRALINVNENGTLKMYDGITLTSNTTEYGGAVHVTGSNSYFYMYGGIITKNNASRHGGGVCVRGSGRFYKTGGIIYGKNTGTDSNTTDGNGAAVCYVHSDGTAYKDIDTTLGINNNYTIE